MMRRTTPRARGLGVASTWLGTCAFFGSIAACGFGVDLEGLFGLSVEPAPELDGGGGDAAPADAATTPKARIAQLGAGDNFACARRVDGTVTCWGAGQEGQLGDGESFSSSHPVLVSDVSDAIELAVGNDHACVLRANHTAMCWGGNGKGQIGDGSTATAPTPHSVLQLSDAVELRAGASSTCARRKDGSVMCWGANNRGQLGDGTTSERKRPAPVDGIVDAIALGGSAESPCALVKSGEVYCWGSNVAGQAGSGTVGGDALTPAKVSGLTGVLALSDGATSDHTCAVLESGEVRCWGGGRTGQLGDTKATNESASPVEVTGLTDAVEVTTGSGITCARHGDGRVSCWGTNVWRQLGLGDDADVDRTLTALPVGSAGVVEGLAAGDRFVCAVQEGGERLVCWGGNLEGALGRGTRVSSDVPVEVVGVKAASLGLGGKHACAADAEGEIMCWGLNTYKQHASEGDAATGTPLRATHASGAQIITGGDNHACALFGTEIRCWGSNTYGAVGNGAKRHIEFPPVVFEAPPAADVAAGEGFTCALLASREVACAGANSSGRLGRPGGDSSSPAVIHMRPLASDPGGGGEPARTPLANVSKLSVGRFHSCAVHDGRVSCWGSSSDGALGVEDDSGPEPVTVRLPRPATDVAAATGRHTCAVLDDGSVRCWGRNLDGQVSGTAGSGIAQRTPDLGGKTAKAVAAGQSHSCALLTDGTVVCWGRGRHGQLGNGARENAAQPVAVKGLTGVKAIAAHGERTCAIAADDAVYCWGSNLRGELGDGVVLMSGAPAPVVGY